METNVHHDTHIRVAPEKTGTLQAMKAVVTGSLGGGIFGAVAAALAVIGLAHVYPQLLLPIAAISIGASLLFEGSSIATRITALTETLGRDSEFKTLEIGIGVTAEFLGGIIAVVLGILALLGMVPLILIPVSIVVFGAALIFSSGLTSRLNELEIQCASESDLYRSVTHEAVSAAESVQFVVGLVAIVLGILALLDIAPQILSLVAVLAIGFSIFINGGALAARMASAYRTC